MTAPAGFFAGLPAPTPGKLVVYVFGPRPGEAQVIALPDGRWVVIDGCVQDNVNVPLELLRRHDVEKIDLLVITHPDLDHYRGIAELIEAVEVGDVWRYPGLVTQRDTVARLCDIDPASTRWTELRQLFDVLDALARENRAHEVGLGHKSWPLEHGSPYSFELLAPCSADRHAEMLRWQALLEKVCKGERLTEDDEGHLVIRRADEGRGNPLSLAVALRWGDVGVLFGGDVEFPGPGTKRGWDGILDWLERNNQLALVTSMALVKAAHHGSNNAFCDRAWVLHASRAPVHAVVTPFSGAKGQPPHRPALESIKNHARRLSLTTQPHSSGWDEVTAAAWSLDVSASSGQVRGLAFVFGPGGLASEHLSGDASAFK